MAAGKGCCSCCSTLTLALLAAAGACLAGLYATELETFRSNGPGAKWVNWIGDFDCGEGVSIERPSSVEELQAVVNKYSSLRAAATGHSFNTFACPAVEKGSAVVDMQGFRKLEVIKVDGGMAVRVEAGLKMGQLQNELMAKGLTLRVPPGNSAYTVGGCIATGCHNLGQSHAQDLMAVTLVLANGTIREVSRGMADFDAVAVSLGRLGIILSVTLQALPYRTLQWKSEQIPLPSTPEVIDILGDMSTRQKDQESTGNKLVFYTATGVLMMEHWLATGRAAELQESPEPLPPYVNSQPFRVGQGTLSAVYRQVRDLAFALVPLPLLTALQVPAETAFRGLHSSPMMAKVRKAMGWQHSPEARGEASVRPTGNQFTWAGFLDEVVNLFMGLRHIEVIFPIEPKERAVKCLDIVLAHNHLTWWRMNVRTQKSEGFHLSPTHAPSGTKPTVFLRVDFVAPGPLLDLPSGEASLTSKLHKDCPGWRKHWGKGLFKTSAEEQWGDAEEFLKAAAQYDPTGKFVPRNQPTWLSR